MSRTIIGEATPGKEFQKRYTRPLRIGVVFSGGPAPGGHNVIGGIFDAAKKANPESRLFGFLMGPDGIIENRTMEITDEMVDEYRNLGGFTMIKTGRTKIDTEKKMAMSKATCKQLGLDALVVVGGDDSNTNAAFLAQEMFADGVQVIGVPKTIDGDIQVRDCQRRTYLRHVLRISYGRPLLCQGDQQSDHGLQLRCQILAYLQGHGAGGQPSGPGSGASDPRQHDPDR